MEIEYRVWCKNKNEWEKDPCFMAEDGTLWQVTSSGHFQPCKKSTHIVEWYIGLKDEKRTKKFPDGQKIYQFDICEYVPPSTPYDQNPSILTGVIEYIEEVCSFRFVCKNEEEHPIHSDVILKVIGNMRENPELINK